ncbi:ADP-ribose pyrophosphatase [hydrothermal vent metagenome]|uniref:ADP-ribose pyrophosphatase n=1 Tax=hydrothermal vent metagenome TaxID=652676 RepID=A0A3B1DAB3_9ZZZZ
MKKYSVCLSCGANVEEWVNPKLTVDIIIEIDGGIVLIERGQEPSGWAIPGGFVDYGESLESAAVREAKEETGLDVTLLRQFHAYSDPSRDTRQHNVSIVFIAKAEGKPEAGDDAKNVAIFTKETLPRLVFDHASILNDYFEREY